MVACLLQNTRKALQKMYHEKCLTSGLFVTQLQCIFILMFKVRVYFLVGIGTADSLCAKAELWDSKPKLLCGSGSAERQVAVYFLCGSGNTELPSIIPCAEAELQTLKSHNILCAEAELRNLKSQYIPSVEAELRQRVT